MARCPKCVDTEPICLYCPTCQYVVSSEIAAMTGNTCPRNCLQCSDCGANTIVTSEGEKYNIRCSRCEFSYKGLEKRSFSGQIREQQPELAEFKRLQAIYRRESSSESQAAQPLPLPALVRLHARSSRYCKACRHILVQPEPAPGIKFQQKSMALAMVPKFLVEDSRLRVTNPLAIDMTITLKSSQVMFESSTLTLGPLAGGHDEASLIKQVPETLIARESNASRQVYMSGIRKTTEWGQQGPNWAATNFSVADGTGPMVRVLCCIRYDAGNKSREINLWIRWPAV